MDDNVDDFVGRIVDHDEYQSDSELHSPDDSEVAIDSAPSTLGLEALFGNFAEIQNLEMSEYNNSNNDTDVVPPSYRDIISRRSMIPSSRESSDDGPATAPASASSSPPSPSFSSSSSSSSSSLPLSRTHTYEDSSSLNAKIEENKRLEAVFQVIF